MQFNTQGTNPEGGPGKYVEKAGMYHFVINEFEDQSNSQYPKLCFACEVIGGEHADQVGKLVNHDLFLPEGSQYPEDTANKLLWYACAIGIYSKLQWDADLKAGRAADVPFENSAGMQFIGKVELKPDKTDPTKKWARISRSWAVGDDDVAPVPKSADHLSVFDGKLPRSDGTFRDASKPIQKQQSAPAQKPNGHAGQQKQAASAATATAAAPKNPPLDLPPATEEDLFG